MPNYQSESKLENTLIQQLQDLGYQKVKIHTPEQLQENLKKQLEKLNQDKLQGTPLSDKEFTKILVHLQGGNLFEKSKKLRDRYALKRDDDTVVRIKFLELKDWCHNLFQVTNQVTQTSTYQNRYDVTLLINGFPLVQIELKRRGLELKEAFNQILRYKKHSMDSSDLKTEKPLAYQNDGFNLYQYLQLFVVSNGVNTKYFSNNRHKHLKFKQTFYWSDAQNNRISNLQEFTDTFLEPCHLSKIITKYIVLNETSQMLMALRPYQFYATEAIIQRVKESDQNGYIWHTTGSGKTLTSFKASQLLVQDIPSVKKVLFVVDRNDLDGQTIKEYNSFQEGSVDTTNNTHHLVQKFKGSEQLIVTTIQKLNNAIKNPRYKNQMEEFQDDKLVFIFDECHRSQFGETHQRITEFFPKSQMFGFTGTPIFAENAIGKKTTKDLFHKQLHTYLITDAIRDENVLKFSTEYVGKYETKDTANNLDIKVENINTKELEESPQRLQKVAEYILQHHDRKTHNRKYTAMFCVSSVDVLIKYYEIFKKLDHELNISTIFSYSPNYGEVQDPNDLESDLDPNHPDFTDKDNPTYVHTREKLDEFIDDYNKSFGTNYSTNTYYEYYRDIMNRVKSNQVDILLVVNMFLTGFDSKTLNTLYVDKNLQYHGLIQAFSRTNRILDETKSQGNIVCFRNLKPQADQALKLFSNPNAKEEVFMEPYENYIQKFKESYQELLKLTPTINSVDQLSNEKEELAFVKAFRKLVQIKNILTSFADFDFQDLTLTEQTFEDYKSKYLDLYDKSRRQNQTEKVSILNDVDFQLELIHSDEINVTYIMSLLQNLKQKSDQQVSQEKIKEQKEKIIKLIQSEPSLRSKRELIEEFIQQKLFGLETPDQIIPKFREFITEKGNKLIKSTSQEINMPSKSLLQLISSYLYTDKLPTDNEIIDNLNESPGILDRLPTIKKVQNFIQEFVKTYKEDIPDTTE